MRYLMTCSAQEWSIQQGDLSKSNRVVIPIKLSRQVLKELHESYVRIVLMDFIFLWIVDGYSKWPDIEKLKNTTATQTIDVLGTFFSSFG